MSDHKSAPDTHSNRIIDILAVVNRTIGVAARNVAACLLGVMVVIVLLQVVFRYVLNDSLTWSEELARVLMVWSAFLVAPWAYRKGSFVAIEMFTDALPKRLHRAMILGIHLLVLWVVAVFFRESLGFWERGLSIRAASIPVAMAWFYAVVPFSFGALFLVGCELVVRNIMMQVYPHRDYQVVSEQTVAGE